ncbi:cullin-9 [Platysternon megacephalum]|uniref:Cullin-9 n=1 Tax=Platysternon megacephalum TaxID=55544 RepID=A0A4D9DDC2_9SAUR|nr:cullin-9 [Platysternon megacephalum]
MGSPNSPSSMSSCPDSQKHPPFHISWKVTRAQGDSDQTHLVSPLKSTPKLVSWVSAAKSLHGIDHTYGRPWGRLGLEGATPALCGMRGCLKAIQKYRERGQS